MGCDGSESHCNRSLSPRGFENRGFGNRGIENQEWSPEFFGWNGSKPVITEDSPISTIRSIAVKVRRFIVGRNLQTEPLEIFPCMFAGAVLSFRVKLFAIGAP